MKTHRLKFASPALVAAAVGVVIWVNAGNLDPPSGAISPTMKDLDDVEPRTAIRNSTDLNPVVISSSGSYYLAENILALPSQDAIQITTGNVTLDLNGFSIIGNTDTGSNNGIAVTANRHGITIKNGTISPFLFGDGISAFASDNLVVQNVRVIGNVRGIIAGQSAHIVDCIVSNNLNDGITVGDHCIVARCQAIGNGGAGIRTVTGAIVTACTAMDNGGDGIRTGTGSTVRGCNARNNTSDGITANLSLVHGSAATGNSGAFQIFVGAGTKVDNHE